MKFIFKSSKTVVIHTGPCNTRRTQKQKAILKCSNAINTLS